MNKLSDAAAAALAEVKIIGNEIAALQAKAKQRRLDAMQPFLDSLAASGAVSLIVIRGHTPGFNDGEPCEHSADFWVNGQQIGGDEVLSYGLDGFDTEPFEFLEELESTHTWNNVERKSEEVPGAVERNVKLCADHGHVYLPPSADILKAIEELIFNTVEEDSGTDYYVIYVLKDGKFEVFKGDYDCGY